MHLLRFSVLVVVLAFSSVPSLLGQTITLEATSPENEAVGIAADQPVDVQFTVSRALTEDAFNQLIDEPDGAEIADQALSDNGRTLTLSVTHEPDRDYLWDLGGFAEDAQGELVFLAPTTLRYTTAAGFDPAYALNGNVTAGEGDTPDFAFILVEVYAVAESDFYGEDDLVDRRTVTEPGAFTFSSIRPGTYRLRALGFTEAGLEDLRTQGGNPSFDEVFVGFYDANADEEADAIEVSDADHSDLDIDLGVLGDLATTAATAEVQARTLAQQHLERQLGSEASDLELYAIEGRTVLLSGTGFWTYQFYTESLDRHVTAVLDPLQGTQVTSESLEDEASLPDPLPESYVDSDALFTTLAARDEVQDLLAQNPEPAILVRGGKRGDDGSDSGPAGLYPDHFVWEVTFRDFNTDGDADGTASLTAYVDMQTGDVLSVLQFPALGWQTAATYETQARAAIEGVAGEGATVELAGLETSEINITDGTSSGWMITYQVHQEGGSDEPDVLVVHYGTDDGGLVVRGQPDEAVSVVIPDEYLDSDEALEIMEAEGGEAFRNEHPNARLEQFAGGYQPDLAGLNPDAADQPAWVITYQNASSADYLTIYIDMATGDVLATDSDTGSPVDEPEEVPRQTSLLPNYPNPFNPTTQIPFTLQRTEAVRLVIYNLLGQEISTLVDGVLPAGSHEIRWDAQGMPSGIYMYELRTEAGAQRRSMVLLQ